ncbi:MAG: hypothetical protein HC793_04720 [Aquincola sp.]|nr:hypothetical protein [Aquincola sp.]
MALAGQLGIPYIDLDSTAIDRNLARVLNKNFARRHVLLPVAQNGRTLTIAMDDPTRERAGGRHHADDGPHGHRGHVLRYRVQLASECESGRHTPGTTRKRRHARQRALAGHDRLAHRVAGKPIHAARRTDRGRPSRLCLPRGHGRSRQLAYRDVTMDVGSFDYVAILETFKACILRWHPQALIYLVTSSGSPLVRLGDERTRVVELDLPFDQPMYQRVAAMCAYAHSPAFAKDTLFLDSDAFLNARFTDYLDADYDVAVTVRSDPGLMPVNEGVIVARAERRSAVVGFFDRYLATYEVLLTDDRIQSYYGDIRKWRGGQLSLNAITRAAHPYSGQRRMSIGDARLQCLPCDPFNYSYEYGTTVAPEQLRSKVVLHMKGGRKSDLRAVRAVLGSTVAPTVKPSQPAQNSMDRKYSLDTTFPEEYFPPTPIDFSTATLTEIADHFKTDKGTIKHRYTEVYSRYLDGYRGKSLNLLEIGVACGSSLKTWSAYLGDRSGIVGVDIRKECEALCRSVPNIRILTADAATFSSDEVFDVIVDDGSHVSKDIVLSWQNLWRQVRPGGLYFIEDMRCTHDEVYRRNFTFPKADSDFDRRHVMQWLDEQMRAMDYSKSDIDFIHTYRQLIVLRKKI